MCLLWLSLRSSDIHLPSVAVQEVVFRRHSVVPSPSHPNSASPRSHNSHYSHGQFAVWLISVAPTKLRVALVGCWSILLFPVPEIFWLIMNKQIGFIAAILIAAPQSAESFAPSPITKVRASSTSIDAFFGFGRKRARQADDPIKDSENLQQNLQKEFNPIRDSRRSFLSTGVSVTAATSLLPLRTNAGEDKLTNISDADLKQIILNDIVDKSFLVTADITRSVYDESATFTDEIDVYTMDKWIKGTKSLFIPSGSRVSLVGDVTVTPGEVTFRFDEDLMFNIPFKPVCSLSGKVVLTRDEKSGLITSYREYWDQSVNDVLKTAKFGKKV
jgi:hypothetical protein